MKSLSEEFREIRRVSTPIVVVKTTDYRVTMRELLKVRVNGENAPPAAVWNCVDGPVSLNPKEDVEIGSNEDAPFMILQKAVKNLQAGGILFWVVSDDFTQTNHSWTNTFTIQAVANLRDEFKADNRTLVILSIDGKLPSLFTDDVPLLEDPLPSEDELKSLAKGLVETVNKELAERKRKPIDVPVEVIDKGAKLCRGMNRFAAEEAISRNLSKSGLDLDNLAQAQRLNIEQASERVLTFERGSESFDDIGGLENIKDFSRLLFGGERPPSVIVRIEEIEKAMAGSTGLDSTGVSQDQLGVLLTCMEDFEWTGLIAVGPAGSGKSMISKAMGNTNKALTLNLDLGAAKGQYVGQSEAKIRKAMGILRGVAGSGAFFIGTSNGLSIIPPELRRRFKFGVYYFDIPTQAERAKIWEINLKRFKIDPSQEMPKDDEWVGSDIRNVCDLADRLRCSLIRAAGFIVPVAKSSPEAITKLRDAAHGKFLSASEDGVYMKPDAKKGRSITI